MPLGAIVLLAMLSPTATGYGPELPTPPAKPKFETAGRPDSCVDQKPKNENEIVVCAPRADGYRINPDIMAAKREARAQLQGLKPRETYKDTTACQSVGPFGCTGTPTINLIQAGIVLAQMAKTAASGGNVGKMFVTQPQKTEYELYREAKARREASEKAAAAAAYAQAARAQLATAKAATPPTSPQPSPAAP